MTHIRDNDERRRNATSPKRSAPDRERIDDERLDDGSGTVGNRGVVESIQRSLGNQKLQHLARTGTIQRSPHDGGNTDAAERQAGRVADDIVRPASSDDAAGPHLGERSRTTDERPPVLRQPDVMGSGSGSGAARAVADDTSRSDLGTELEDSGGGRPLPGTVRSFFETRFGRDFGDVRVHEGSKAARLTDGLDAAAFTHGRDVYFGAGNFRPETPGGTRLLAHELTHVVQQRHGDAEAVQRQQQTEAAVGSAASQTESATAEAAETADLEAATRSLAAASSEEGLRRYRDVRSQLYERTRIPGKSTIEERPPFYSAISERKLEIVLGASDTTGVPPEVILTNWIQEGGSNMAADGRPYQVQKRFTYGGQNIEIDTEAHARAVARSFFLWNYYGLDIVADIVPQHETKQRFGTQLDDSRIAFSTQADHDRRLANAVSNARSNAGLPSGIDFRANLNAGLTVSEQPNEWYVEADQTFDEYAVMLMAGIKQASYAQASEAKPETREILGLSEEDELPPPMARLAYAGGHGGLNKALTQARDELETWGEETRLREVAVTWATRVERKYEEYCDLGIVDPVPDPLGPFAEAMLAGLEVQEELLEFLLGFESTQAGSRIFPDGMEIPEEIRRDPTSEEARKQWPELLEQWHEITSDVLADRQRWRDVQFDRADKWLMHAQRAAEVQLEPWQDLMRPQTTVVEDYHRTVVKFLLLHFQSKQIFGGALEEER